MILTVLLTIIHVIVCLILIIVVLLQSGKAADLAGAFGGMGSQTVFGPRGAATALSRATTIAAVLFMVTSLSLSVIASRQSGDGGPASVLEGAQPAQTQQQPAAPAGQAPAPVQTGKPVEPGQLPAGQPKVEIVDPSTGKAVKEMPLSIPPQNQPDQKKK